MNGNCFKVSAMAGEMNPRLIRSTSPPATDAALIITRDSHRGILLRLSVS